MTRTRAEEMARLRSAIDRSGLSARRWAVEVARVSERSVRRWLAGECRISRRVREDILGLDGAR